MLSLEIQPHCIIFTVLKQTWKWCLSIGILPIILINQWSVDEALWVFNSSASVMDHLTSDTGVQGSIPCSCKSLIGIHCRFDKFIPPFTSADVLSQGLPWVCSTQACMYKGEECTCIPVCISKRLGTIYMDSGCQPAWTTLWVEHLNADQ